MQCSSTRASGQARVYGGDEPTRALAIAERRPPSIQAITDRQTIIAVRHSEAATGTRGAERPWVRTDVEELRIVQQKAQCHTHPGAPNCAWRIPLHLSHSVNRLRREN